MTVKRSTWIAILFFSACLKPIEIVTERVGEELIISGQISTIDDQSFIRVDFTADEERLPYPVSGATILLFEDNVPAATYDEDATSPGRYLMQHYQAIAGKTYHIEVVLADGRTYVSDTEKMPEEPGSLSSYYEFAKEEIIDGEGLLIMQDFVKIYVDAILPTNTERYFRWFVEEVYIIIPTSPPAEPVTRPPCFVIQSADPQAMALLDRQHINTTKLPDKFLLRRSIDHTFLHKHYFVTYQSALTAEAHDYWRKVETLITANGSIFDPPPAKIFGNLHRTAEGSKEKVYGYFQAVNQTLSRVYTTPDIIPIPMIFTDCVGIYVRYPLPSRCANCLSVKNSTLSQPPWF